jgi:hypothetical protein
MHAIIPQDLDLYPTMDQRQIKAIDADCSVNMGYRASKNIYKNTKSMPQ